MTPLFSSTDCQPPASNQSDRSSQWRVRVAQLEDMAGVAEILADSFHSREGVLGWAYPFLRLGIYEDIRNRLRSTSPHHTCLVAVSAATTATIDVDSYGASDRVTGTLEMAVRYVPLGTSDRSTDARSHSCRYPYLSNLAVHPHYRRRGVARQLLLSCEQIAYSWGFNDLYLHVLENNHQARQLYFKLGYRLHQVDTNWSAWLLRRPRQLLLHKHLAATNS